MRTVKTQDGLIICVIGIGNVVKKKRQKNATTRRKTIDVQKRERFWIGVYE